MPRVACFQSDVAYGDHAANLSKAASALHEAKDKGVELLVLPECFVSGYCVTTREEAELVALELDAAVEALQPIVDQTQVVLVMGMARKDGDKLWNSAILLEPGQAARVYDKTHLPLLGFDRHVEPGGSIPVFETRIGRIGIGVCFDVRSPEFCRVLMLKGADILALPTNWPNGGSASADIVAPARAAENRIFVAACNRVGEENGFRFIGKSGIYNPLGQTLAKAGDQEEWIMADLDFAESRLKRTIVIPGVYETTVIESRRPELYAPLLGPDRQ